MLFLSGIAFWFIHVLRCTTCFKVVLVSFIPFRIVIISLGEEGAVCVLLVHLIVCFARVSLCPFSRPLGVIVALPGLFY